VVVSAASSPGKAHDPRAAESTIYRKTAGEHWREVREGLPQVEGRIVTVLAANRDEPSVFYALTNEGLYRSSDAGASWGPPGDRPSRLLRAPDRVGDRRGGLRLGCQTVSLTLRFVGFVLLATTYAQDRPGAADTEDAATTADAQDRTGAPMLRIDPALPILRTEAGAPDAQNAQDTTPRFRRSAGSRHRTSLLVRLL
jgi:hypothetical protein